MELLSQLADSAARQWPEGLGPRLRRELLAERARLHDELSLYERCVVWLERRRLATRSRPRGRDTASVWSCTVSLRADLDALCDKAASESTPRGAHTSAVTPSVGC